MARYRWAPEFKYTRHIITQGNGHCNLFYLNPNINTHTFSVYTWAHTQTHCIIAHTDILFIYHVITIPRVQVCWQILKITWFAQYQVSSCVFVYSLSLAQVPHSSGRVIWRFLAVDGQFNLLGLGALLWVQWCIYLGMERSLVISLLVDFIEILAYQCF